MLEILRKGSQTWVVKGLMVLLVLSFGVWGVSTSLVTGSSDAVVTVGDVKVSPSDFRLAYERQVAQLSRQFGTRLSREQAKAFGVEAQVYSQLVAGATLDQLSNDMNLGLSQDRLATLISEDPAFRGVNGQFDRLTFSSVLRNAGLREQDYINNRSQVAVRSQIVEALSDGYTPPKVLGDALRQYRNQTRTIEYLLLSNANVDPIKAPSDDVLKPWFESHKAEYRAPEFRKISYVKLEPADIVDPASVTEEEIRAEYDKRKDSFLTPETRTVEQLSFPSRAEADAASVRIAAGTSFDELVSGSGKTASDVLLGDFTRDRMPDAKLADAAFAVTADGQTTPVVDGAFGAVILRVTNIKPETVRSYDEVKEELRQELALSNAGGEIMAIHDKFEEARVSGTPMKEAADQTNLKLVVLNAVDARGNDTEGEQIAGIPEAKTLLEEAFKAEVGAETLPVNLGRDGYVWFDVEGITPSRDRTLDEAREKVVVDWTAEQQRNELAAKAVELKGRAEKGETLAAIAAELGIAVETKSGLRRSVEDAALSPAAVIAAFGGANGLVANAPGVGGEGQILLKVTEVDDNNPGDALDNDDRQINAIAQASGDDILDQMVSELQKGYGVAINQQLADLALSQQP
ncbi:SurA N-terminal domain-containing protein [Pararhizobium sp. BT-229]|uniref:SurA N-terminal domain-containing protein n=1 Tax=Pararhizobium sp. BT-229 TaxID=2986923 RepID=UPI0021F7246B|nr:SurA N-terminal domain-containing protein [Pararhizobium sp. BT-229]MCV9965192.1 SurA N-terminal domain-containing protein [Pararhizobium sp. BT-229]